MRKISRTGLPLVEFRCASRIAGRSSNFDCATGGKGRSSRQSSSRFLELFLGEKDQNHAQGDAKLGNFPGFCLWKGKVPELVLGQYWAALLAIAAAFASPFELRPEDRQKPGRGGQRSRRRHGPWGGPGVLTRSR